MCLLIVWLSEGKGNFIVVECDPKCISIKSMHKHSITYIQNCTWVPSSLLVSCTCLPSCEQRGYSSQIQRKNSVSRSHTASSLKTLQPTFCDLLIQKSNSRPGRNRHKVGNEYTRARTNQQEHAPLIHRPKCMSI